MVINKELLNRLEKLAMIEVEEDKKEEVKNQLSDIVDFMEKIQSVDTDNVTLQNHQKTPLRSDIASEANIAKDILKNAPSMQDGFFIVPKIIE